jgi:threonine dehydratase
MLKPSLWQLGSIVMPNTSSTIKEAAVRNYGAMVTECIPTLQARDDTAKEVIEQERTHDSKRKVHFAPHMMTVYSV